MSLSTQPVKGARDFYPEQMRLQKYIFDTWRKTCELFGYEEYDAPILEPTELYLSKGNEEIIQEQTYTFMDRGDRSMTLRTEMTPTVSRMVAAKRQELPYPLRWYSIPQCWRYERMQRGRGREFYQLNVDIFGVEGLAADAEVISVADAIMQSFKAKRDMYVIKINSRKLMNYVMTTALSLNETQSGLLSKLIDRRAKMDTAEFAGQVDAIFSPSQREAGASDHLFALLDVKSLDDLSEELLAQPPVTDMHQLMTALASNGITNVVFDPSLMRGFEYYSDIVFEVFDIDPANNRSMFGGGRYDGMLEVFGAEPVPTVGFGMGDITLMNFLETHDLVPVKPPETDVYMVLIGEVSDDAQNLASELREMGVNVAVDYTGRKPDKQIKAAAKKGIRFVMFVGEKEIQSEQYTIKDLVTSQEETHGLQRIVSAVKDFRKK